MMHQEERTMQHDFFPERNQFQLVHHPGPRDVRVDLTEQHVDLMCPRYVFDVVVTIVESGCGCYGCCFPSGTLSPPCIPSPPLPTTAIHPQPFMIQNNLLTAQNMYLNSELQNNELC